MIKNPQMEPIVPGLVPDCKTDSVTLRSTVYHMEVQVPRATIREKYPTSMIGSILEREPDIKVIDIPNADVTPNALTALQRLLTEEKFPLVQSEYVKAGNYLGIDELGLLAQSGFMQKFTVPAVTSRPLDRRVYEALVNLAIDVEDPYLAWYVMARTPSDQTQLGDEKALRHAVERQNLVMFDALMKRGAHISDTTFQSALHGNNEMILTRLVQQSGSEPSTDVMITAARHNQVTLVRMLLQHPKTTGYQIQEGLKSAAETGSLDVLRIILADRRSDPNITFGRIHPEADKIILADPRYQRRKLLRQNLGPMLPQSVPNTLGALSPLFPSPTPGLGRIPIGPVRQLGR